MVCDFEGVKRYLEVADYSTRNKDIVSWSYGRYVGCVIPGPPYYV